MVKKSKDINTNPLARRLSVSLAGLGSGSRYALGGLGNMLKSDDARASAKEALIEREAQRFVAELGQLKGAYVKIGQMMAIYAQHVLPAPLTEALLQLNDQNTALPWPTIEAVIRRELGGAYRDFSVDPIPIAAASLAQVHRAERRDGRRFCFKVQYPGIAATIDSDFADFIQIMRLARWLRRDASTEGVLEEVRSLLRQEVDYIHEAENSRQYLLQLGGDPRYRIPAVYPEYSTSTLMVMDYVSGDKLNSPHVRQLSQASRNTLAVQFLELFLNELFEWPLMQTDPNFGNYLVSDGQLVLLDFGAVRDFPAKFRAALQQTVVGAISHDLALTQAGLLALGFFRVEHSAAVKQTFVDLCYLLVEPLRSVAPDTPAFAVNSAGEYCWAESRLVRRAAKLAAASAKSREFSLPAKEFAFVTRKLSGVFGAMAALGAELDSTEIVAPYITRWRASQNSGG